MERGSVERLGFRVLSAYGVGAIVSAAKTVAINCFLLLFYNQVMGLPAIAVSAIIMVSLVCDAVFDPLVGRASDNFRSRWGRRIPFMYASAIPVATLFVLLWTPPINSSALVLEAWLAVCLIGVRLFDSFFELPHLSLVPELTSDSHQRTRLFTVRSVCESVSGMGIAFLAYNVFMKERPDGSGGLLSLHGYGAFAGFTGCLILVAIVMGTLFLQRVLRSSPRIEAGSTPRISLYHELIDLLQGRQVWALLLAGSFISIGSGIGGGLSMYWLLYLFRLSQVQLSLVFLPITFAMLLSSLTPLISARMGKRNAVILLCWGYFALCTVPLLARITHVLPVGSPILFGLVMGQAALGAVAIVMVQILLSSMMADQVEDIQLRTGRRSEGLLFAVNNFTRKTMLGLGTLGAGVILAVVSFPAGAQRREVADSVLVEMAVVYLAVKLLLFLGATAALLLFRYDASAHAATLNRLSTGSDTFGSASKATSEIPVTAPRVASDGTILG